MKAQKFRYPAAALIAFCFLGGASAQNGAMKDLLGETATAGAAAQARKATPDIPIPHNINSDDEFAYIDPSKIVPQKPLKIALKYYKLLRRYPENRLYVHIAGSQFETPSLENAKLRSLRYLSVIDFTQHNKKKRFYLIDMATGQVEQLLVAHGQGSDPYKTGYATAFSNIDSQHTSSLGFYMTDNTYNGDNGYSLRLDGLSETNSNARTRAIVIHGAKYVRAGGRSWGCPAVEPSKLHKLVAKIKGGSLIYAYHENFSREK